MTIITCPFCDWSAAYDKNDKERAARMNKDYEDHLKTHYEEKDLVEAHVEDIPNCNYPHSPAEGKVPAVYDARSKSGPWAYMCQAHFDRYGVGLGMGKGQKLTTN